MISKSLSWSMPSLKKKFRFVPPMPKQKHYKKEGDVVPEDDDLYYHPTMEPARDP